MIISRNPYSIPETKLLKAWKFKERFEDYSGDNCSLVPIWTKKIAYVIKKDVLNLISDQLKLLDLLGD